MELLKILESESTNSNKINLYLIGGFYKCYEQSAYLFVQHIKAYRVKKLYVKKVSRPVCSLGFPVSALESVKFLSKEKHFDVLEDADLKAVFISKLPDIDSSDFNEWQESQIEIEKEQSEIKSTGSEELIRKIRSFPLANSTPLKCMEFVGELQAII